MLDETKSDVVNKRGFSAVFGGTEQYSAQKVSVDTNGNSWDFSQYKEALTRTAEDMGGTLSNIDQNGFNMTFKQGSLSFAQGEDSTAEVTSNNMSLDGLAGKWDQLTESMQNLTSNDAAVLTPDLGAGGGDLGAAETAAPTPQPEPKGDTDPISTLESGALPTEIGTATGASGGAAFAAAGLLAIILLAATKIKEKQEEQKKEEKAKQEKKTAGNEEGAEEAVQDVTSSAQASSIPTLTPQA